MSVILRKSVMYSQTGSDIEYGHVVGSKLCRNYKLKISTDLFFSVTLQNFINV